MLAEALESAKEQLGYWQAECAAAEGTRDQVRLENCRRHHRQCELIIRILELVASRPWAVMKPQSER